MRRWRHLKRIVAKIEADPKAKFYMDDALTPVGEEDAEHMELYNQSESIKAAVQHERRVAGHPKNGHHGNGRDHAHQGNGRADTGRPERPARDDPRPVIVPPAA